MRIVILFVAHLVACAIDSSAVSVFTEGLDLLYACVVMWAMWLDAVEVVKRG